MNPEGGYTRQYRRMWDNPVFRSYQEAAVFSWMKDVAQWRETTIRTKFGPIKLGVGEFLMAERPTADAFGLHRNTLRSLIHRMVDEGMIEAFLDRCPQRAGTVYRIKNYEAYQGLGDGFENVEDRKRTANGTGAGPQEDRKRTKNKEENTGNKGKEEREGDFSPVADAPGAPSDPAPTGTGDLFAEPPTPPTPAEPKSPRGTRLAVDWSLPAEWRDWATEKGASPDAITREAEKFRDYWHAKAGADARKVDWYATWRTWMRRSLDNPRSGDRHGSHRPTDRAADRPVHGNAWAEVAHRTAAGRA